MIPCIPSSTKGQMIGIENKSVVIYWVSECEEGTDRKGTQEIKGFCIFTVVMATQLYTFVKLTKL